MNRYGMEHYYDQGSEMVEKTEGEYVLYEDVADLQRQLDEARALINDLNRFDLPKVARFAIESYLEETK